MAVELSMTGLKLILLFHAYVLAGASSGYWQVLVDNAGVSAMHMTVLHTNKVIIFDRTDSGPSLIKLPNSHCRNASADLALKIDCWAHSVEYDVASNSIRPLEVLTDTWCSSGAFSSDGTLVQTGGWNDGGRAVRRFKPCGACDWVEQPGELQKPRWYASTQILPDDRVIVVGGRAQFNYEFVPGDGGYYVLPFLQQTRDGVLENNLYPFLHLSSDGNLFIFANSESILFNYEENQVVRQYPTLPGGARNYPASGSSVMLPLKASESFSRVEVMICGGAEKVAYKDARTGTFTTALDTCGRMVITDTDPSWSLEQMPSPRVMGDMLNLPTGEILIINGAQEGTAGWGLARKPATTPVLYRPNSEAGDSRFVSLASTSIPRMYHSTAVLLPDGRVLVAGSNTNVGYNFQGVPFPTELRIEGFYPHYMDTSLDIFRPRNVSLSSSEVAYGSEFQVQFQMIGAAAAADNFEIVALAPSFSTHAYSMNQRALNLAATSPAEEAGVLVSTVQAPPNNIVAPPGYYMLFVVNKGAPSGAEWIKFNTY